MTQVNCDSKTSRKIQRTAAGGSKVFGHKDGEDDGYAGAVGFLSETVGDTKVMFEPSWPAAHVAEQKKLGPQSLRKQKKDYGPIVSKDEHGRKCFDEMLKNEKEFCGEWVVFYHSYSSAALLYEVQAAVAEFAALPRLLCAPFHHIPTAKRMLEEFPKWKDQDHNQAFRLVGLCGTSSLLAHDSEAPAKSVFLAGYSVGPLKGVLEKLLGSCGVPAGKVKALAADIIKLAVKSGLDCGGIPGGKKCKSGRSGHMLQIFLRRELCDQYVYPSFPFGVPDKKRDKPLSVYLTQDVAIEGQVRITLNPDVFLRATTARMFTFSADPTFNKNRPEFQEELKSRLEPILGSEAVRRKAAKGIFGGDPPDWWSAEERSRFFSSLHMAILHFSVTRTKAIWQRCPRAATHPHRLTSRLFLATYTVSRKSMENPNKKTTTGLAVWSMSFALFFGSRTGEDRGGRGKQGAKGFAKGSQDRKGVEAGVVHTRAATMAARHPSCHRAGLCAECVLRQAQSPGVVDALLAPFPACAGQQKRKRLGRQERQDARERHAGTARETQKCKWFVSHRGKVVKANARTPYGFNPGTTRTVPPTPAMAGTPRVAPETPAAAFASHGADALLRGTPTDAFLRNGGKAVSSEVRKASHHPPTFAIGLLWWKWTRPCRQKSERHLIIHQLPLGAEPGNLMAMDLSPMSAYFDGPQVFFGGNAGEASHDTFIAGILKRCRESRRCSLGKQALLALQHHLGVQVMNAALFNSLSALCKLVFLFVIGPDFTSMNLTQ
eukprot:symbB.v1.2.010057.t1/scaffold636.1/size252712/12